MDKLGNYNSYWSTDGGCELTPSTQFQRVFKKLFPVSNDVPKSELNVPTQFMIPQFSNWCLRTY
jgi:hypothetical protein